MNNSEQTRDTESLKSAIHSLQDWWALAGVDIDYEVEPSAMLTSASDKKALDVVSDSAPNSILPPQQAVTENPEAATPCEDYPAEFDAFQNWLKDPSKLLERSWARKFVCPEGKLEPEIMIISAMPEPGGVDDGQYYSKNESVLLKNMLLAMDVKWDNSFRAALSLGRTIDGRLSENQAKPLLKRALHLISLVKPRRIILFGDTASRAFFGEDLLGARKKKQFINHVSAKTEAIVTFHPRILLERPELKAETWKDLQMLTRNTPS